MKTYYQELVEQEEPWRRSGWRQWGEQAVRFEVATRVLCEHGVSECLDVGCGDGALAEYMRDHAEVAKMAYTGIDCVPEAIALGRCDEDLRCLDYTKGSLEQRWGGVVAIGAAIDGKERAARGERLRQVVGMWRFMLKHARDVAVSFVLQDKFAKDQAALALEEALWGVSREELVWMVERVQRDLPGWHVTWWGEWVPTDWVVVWSREPWESRGRDWGEDVLGHKHAAGRGAYERAWMWWFLGQKERALRALGQGGSAREDVLRARIRIL